MAPKSEDTERLVRVEERLCQVAASLVKMETVMSEMAQVLKSMAVLEEKHNAHTDSLKRAYKELENQEHRIEVIEGKMPNVLLASGWVFKAALVVIGLLSTVSTGIIIKSFFN